MMFNSTQFFEVYHHPLKPEEDSIELVRQGFSLYAFVLHGAWLLYHRLWLEAVLFTALFVALVGVGQQLGWSHITIGITQLALQFWLATNAAEIQGAALERKGFVLRDVSTGSNALDAQRRYYDGHQQA